MRTKLFTLMILFTLCLHITVQASSVSSLTAEQEDVKKQIDEVTSQIMDYEDQVNSIKEKMDENNKKIEELNAHKADNESKIETSRDEINSTLVLMQKMSNTNTLSVYFYDENTLDNNYFLKLDNVNTVFDTISDNMKSFIEEVEKSQQDIDAVNKLKAKNKKELEKMNKKLAEQEELETSLKEELAKIEQEIGKVAIQTASANVSGSKEALMSAAGIDPSQYVYVDYIISKESGWNATADNPMSSAYGLCQSLPGSKMASAGSDWATNPITQMKWCNGYAVGRYGSWASAYNFWLANHWW